MSQAVRLIVLAFTVVCTQLLVSCQPGVLTPPAASWVRADRATFDIIAPSYSQYVHADATLSPGTAEMLLGLLMDWQFRLHQAELLYPPQTVVGLPDTAPPGGELGEGGDG
jgi:hypothetical protein